MRNRPIAVLIVAWAFVASGPALAAESDWQGLVFDEAAFDEVVALATGNHLIPQPPSRVWAWAATYALLARGDVRLLPARLVAEFKQTPEGRATLTGELVPLPCPELQEAAVVWLPAPDARPKPETAAEIRARNLENRALRNRIRESWEGVAFGRPGLDCAVRWLRAQTPPPDASRIWRMAADGYLRALDPHSSLMPTRQFARQESESRTVALVDPGVNLRVRAGALVVRLVHPDAPEARRAVRRGDLLLSIDGKSAAGLTIAQAHQALQGPAGTRVALEVQRGRAKPRVVSLPRLELRNPTVAGALPGDGADVGVVRIPQFATAAEADLRRAVQELGLDTEGRLRAIVLDLRGNSGGWVDQALATADAFLGRGRIVSATLREGPPAEFDAARHRKDLRLPVVVLVDEKCQSACELVTAALQDNERALVIGRPTYGKGTVQKVIEAKRGAWSVILTIAEYLSPHGRSLQALGVTPDLPLPGPAAEPPSREADVPGHLPPATRTPPHACRLVTPALQACMATAASDATAWKVTLRRQDPELAAAVDAAGCLGRK